MGKEYVDTICVGLGYFSNKIGYQSDVYAKNEETIKYLVGDVSGNSQKFIDKYNANAQIVSGRIARIKTFISTLCKVKSKNVELYCSGRIHIPEHTRSLSGSLLGYKTIP